MQNNILLTWAWRALLGALLLGLAGCDARPGGMRELAALAETAPMPHTGDSADDPAIWLDARDPSRSTIIGTDKLGGIAVYDLAGAQLQYLPDGEFNNVDLRQDVPLGGDAVALVAAGDRASNRVKFYRVDPAARTLVAVPGELAPGLEIYGLCMYRSPADYAVYVLVNSKTGAVEQWRLSENSGRLGGSLTRSFGVGSQTEGCVADDQSAQLYIGEERVGVWRYGAEPADGDARAQVDGTGAFGHLASNVEGLALADGPGGGYLLVSSQGSSSFAIYRRDSDNAYVGSFRLVAGNATDAVSDTDGIEALAADLGPRFPGGLFVAQDGTNDQGNQNFKLVSLQQILAP